MVSEENSGDIFDHETSVLETSLALVDSGAASADDHQKLTKEYQKLLKPRAESSNSATKVKNA